METELKFRILGKVKPSKLEAIEWAPFRLGERVVHQLQDAVLDTPDHTLTSQQYGLRLRRDGAGIVLTLKSPGAAQSGARHTREELESLIAHNAAEDVGMWPEDIRSRVEELTEGRPLRPVIEIANKRRTWTVWRDAQLVAELALDEGTIFAAEASEALHEIEVELKGEGTDDDLGLLQQRLKQMLPLADEQRTKLARGVALLGLDTGDDHSGDDGGEGAEMTADASLAEAGRAMLREQWKKLRANERGVREGDPEAVHDMRVATRRMRAMLEVLGTVVYEPEVTRRLRKGLKRIASDLGVVRDAEVWIAAIETYATDLPEDARAGFEPLLTELQARRDAGRSEFLDNLTSKRTERALGELRHFVSTPGAGVRDVGDRQAHELRVGDVAGSILWSRLEAVRAFDRMMPQAPLSVMHELRITCKRLRYTMELFADVLGEEGKRLRNQIVMAQDHLGELHDAEVALPLVERLLEDDPHNLALVRYSAHLKQTRDELWQSADNVWSVIGGDKFRKRLASCIAKI